MKGAFPIGVARVYASQLMNVIQYCHQVGVAHRDLKPENILLDGEARFNLKVIDFGMAKLCSHVGERTGTMVGTQTYMAPEVLDSTVRTTVGYDPFKFDIWSCGILLFIFVIGVPPISKPDKSCWFFNKLKEKKFDAFWNGHKKFVSSPHLDDAAFREMIQGMLAVIPSERFTAPQVINHHWFASGPYADQPTLVAEMRRRKVAIDREAHAEAVKKAREKGETAEFNPFTLDVHRAVSDDASEPAPVLPLEIGKEEGRFYDFHSKVVSPQTIGSRITAALKEMGADVIDKGHYKFKASAVLTSEEKEETTVVFNIQIYYESDADIHRVAIDRREGSLLSMQKLYRLFYNSVSDIAVEPSL